MASSTYPAGNPAPMHSDPPATGTSEINIGSTERILSAVAGGALLIFAALRQSHPTSGVPLALTSGYLLYRGISGNCPINTAIGRNTADQSGSPVEIRKTVTINKPREEVYAFWRQLENLPRFMQHLAEVKQIDQKHSHWKANVPGNVGSLAWDAEITAEEENSRLAWKSVAHSVVDNAGEVIFRDAPVGRGTELQAIIDYRPPAGAIGATVTGWFNPALASMVKEDLRRFKQIMETGEITRNDMRREPEGESQAAGK